MERISEHSQSAFSVKELLLVVAVTCLLLCVPLSALTGGSNSAKLAQCAANLKQLDLVIQTMNTLPVSGGNWPWDMLAGQANAITAIGGSRQMMYCPGFPEQNIDQMWNYSVTGNGGFRALGYGTTLGAARVLADDQSISLTTQRYTLNGSDPSIGPAGATVYISPSQRVLLADATLSSQGQTNPAQAAGYQWTLHTDSGLVGYAPWNVTPYGPWRGSSTPHMSTLTPLGGNVAMLDGHVQWRPFSNMLPRTSGTGDVFWW